MELQCDAGGEGARGLREACESRAGQEAMLVAYDQFRFLRDQVRKRKDQECECNKNEHGFVKS